MLQEDGSSTTAERVARNDSAFRDANDRIEEAAQALDTSAELLLPFLCECADMRCTDVLQLTAAEYEDVRRDPTHFINAHGHVRNGKGWARVVQETERYSVVEKVGEAARVAAELDPRTGESV